MVRNAVHQDHVQVVLNINIPLICRPAVFRWPCTPDGRITVQSAYHTFKSSQAMEDVVAGVNAGSFGQGDSTVWAAIWSAPVWPKG